MVQRRTQAHTIVLEDLKRLIASGEWTIGQRLPSIAQLARRFDVGTGSVREAIRALSSLGIVRVEHGRGIFVTAVPGAPDSLYTAFRAVGAGSMLELCEARRLLEPELAALAAERATEEELRAIHEQAVLMEQLVGQGRDFLQPDIQFHEQIARAAHNLVLARMLAGVSDLLLESRAITSLQPGMDERAVRYHMLIADAIIRHDVLQARLLMLAHVNDAIKAVLEWHGHMGGETAPAQAPWGSPLILMQYSLTSSR